MARLKSDFGAEGWTELRCETPSSVWLENMSNGRFKTHSLPVQAQFAPINSIVATKIDGVVSLILAGNEYQTESNTGRYDASYGLVLKGDGKGNFLPVDPAHSGLVLDGDIRDMKIIGAKLLLVAPNDSKLKTFQLQ